MSLVGDARRVVPEACSYLINVRRDQRRVASSSRRSLLRVESHPAQRQTEDWHPARHSYRNVWLHIQMIRTCASGPDVFTNQGFL